MTNADTDHLRPWASLDPAEQTRLREAYAADPFCLTGTCSLEAKTAHFTAWLVERGVAFTPEDLHPSRAR
ncbi:hypothetical protein [Rhodovulum adriaticum]|uniref:Uncharacterized protein n=1 Tax=Rhodovulum adriaticum TaxID=35804 RepID=A0A4R2NYV0_RHOAD|nr:hypothetical protein [Rhodovulum adriaticum]MBK1634129.1 hypothetical protein [Rhodovulum adriaticum]TCP27322.1 hypothetical protein EV656_101227 [Rhodovulum adriaticum]